MNWFVERINQELNFFKKIINRGYKPQERLNTMDPISQAIVAALQPVADSNNVAIDYSFTPSAPAPVSGVVTPAQQTSAN